jgi:uncharacterized protein
MDFCADDTPPRRLCQAKAKGLTDFISELKNGKLGGDMKSKCPVCKKIIDKATRQDSRNRKYYPFCSDRCKLIDLGKWLDANYTIPAVENDKTTEDVVERDKTKNG